MHCFLQIIGRLDIRNEPVEMTLPVSDIRRIVKSPSGKATIRTIAITQEFIYTEYSYEDFLETLSGFQKVELIEVLSDTE